MTDTPSLADRIDAACPCREVNRRPCSPACDCRLVLSGFKTDPLTDNECVSSIHALADEVRTLVTVRDMMRDERIATLERENEALHRANESISEALNSGDGVYRP